MKYPTIELNADDCVTYSDKIPILNEDDVREMIRLCLRDGNDDMAMNYARYLCFQYEMRTNPMALIISGISAT